MSNRIADTFNRVADFPKTAEVRRGLVDVPIPGKCAIVPESGRASEIKVYREPEDGSWALYQWDSIGSVVRVIITKEQMFALRALFSQDSWF